MKRLQIPILLLTVVFAVFSSHAQTAFQNLGFESANVPVIPAGQFGGFVPIADALPGWSGFAGTTQIAQVLENNATLGAAGISIFGPDFDMGAIISGRYTALLQAGLGPSGSPVDTSIAQTGLVPATARFIEFKAQGNNFSVSFEGHGIPYSALGAGPNYILYAADVSAFAGQAGELRFTSESTPDRPSNGVWLDSITFSPIPEPDTICLATLGAALLGVGLWRQRRQR